MSKHTPGPWNYAALLSGSENDRGWLVAVPGTRVADVWPMCNERGDASPEAEANARLIAAAPDLLKALRLAITVIDTSDPDAMDVVNICDVAIAKAES